MLRTYRALLHLYPADYRCRFAAEMVHAFEEAAEARHGGIGFALSGSLGLLTGAAVEWAAKLTTHPAIRGRCLPDLRMMRPPGVTQEVWFAGAGVQPDELSALQRRVDDLVYEMMSAIAQHDFPRARMCAYQEREARENLRRLSEVYSAADGETSPCS